MKRGLQMLEKVAKGSSVLPAEKKPPLYTNSLGMEFVLIPAGSFIMGSPDSEEGRFPDEACYHVKITNPFYLGKFQVTQSQWEAVMGENPSSFKGADLPVESVSWGDCQEFIRKLNRMEETKKYRLPTEAEWEYAARAGSTMAYSFGDDPKTLGDYAWFEGNSKGSTHPVGGKRPNAWGLYDMHGNVWEWMQDWYTDDFEGISYVEDPKGPLTGVYRVLRGGAWTRYARHCRSANRNGGIPEFRYESYGLRLAFSAE